MIGSQEPRIFHAPPSFSTRTADDVLECARLAGVRPDPWQENRVRSILAEDAAGKWAAFETADCVPRQNGKGGIIEILELGGLYVIGERLIIHSAHEFATSLEAFRRLEELIAGTAEFSSRVKRISRAHGEEGIELKSGQRVRFRTRTKGGGRGFTGDRVILDEAMILPEATIGALLPTMSARPNPQVNYFGSAVDQQVHDHGLAFARLRSRALKGADPSLSYAEWSMDVPDRSDGRPATPDDVSDSVLDDPAQHAKSNPALGIRISAEHVRRERLAMDRRTFAVERGGIGDWPDVEQQVESPISPDRWAELVDVRSLVAGRPWFAFDVSPSRRQASVAVAGRREDGLAHVGLVDRREGVEWLVEFLRGLREHSPAGFVCDKAGPAAALLSELEQAGVQVLSTNAQQYAEGCGLLFDAVEMQDVRHLGQGELVDALKAAGTRSLGDRWAWSRSKSKADITPLVAVTLAHWAVRTQASPGSVYETRGPLVF